MIVMIPNYALMHKLHHIQVFVRKCFLVLYYITVFCAANFFKVDAKECNVAGLQVADLGWVEC